MSEVHFFPKASQGDLSTFWLNFGDDADPPMRQKMIYLTIREVAEVGSGSFNTMGVCDTLGITYPMVNHYFGSRDGLIAEAAFVTYELYVQRIWETVKAAKPDPEARLRAWMTGMIDLNFEIRGWGAVLNYQSFSLTISRLMEEKFGEERKKLFELNIARLAQLIRDLRSKTLSSEEFTIDDYPRAELLSDEKLIQLTTTLAFSCLGIAVWNSGGHAPSQGVTELKEMGDKYAASHIDNMITLVKNS
jgi:AcrR family transcriptional regulator